MAQQTGVSAHLTYNSNLGPDLDAEAKITAIETGMLLEVAAALKDHTIYKMLWEVQGREGRVWAQQSSALCPCCIIFYA